MCSLDGRFIFCWLGRMCILLGMCCCVVGGVFFEIVVGEILLNEYGLLIFELFLFFEHCVQSLYLMLVFCIDGFGVICRRQGFY